MDTARRVFVTLLLAAALPGCSWINSYLGGTDNSLPPTELRPLADPLAIQTLWQTDAGTGQGERFARLRLAGAGGRLFVAGHAGDVSAIDAATGQRLWRADTGITLSAGVGLGDSGLVLIGGLDGEVLALRQGDGGEVWRAQVSSEVLAAPVGGVDIVVVRANDGNIFGLDAAVGERRWLYNYTPAALTLRGASTPVLARDSVIVGLSTGRLLLLDLGNGRLIGERSIGVLGGRTELERVHDIDAELRLVGGVAYVAAYQGNVSAVDLRDGTVRWNRPLSSHSGVDVDDRHLYVNDDDDTVWALDLASGAPRWQQDGLRGRRLSAPVAVGSHVVVGDFEGYLHWLDAGSGELRGRRRVAAAIDVAPLADRGVVFVLDADGGLSALRAAAR